MDVVKFGETLTDHADGNPEPSPEKGRCRDLTATTYVKRYGEEKVQTTNMIVAVKTVAV